MNTVAERVRIANSYVGSRSMSGWCEKFVRTCFGFPAVNPSALIAWNRTKIRHADINNAPAGVPIFWRLHPKNKNYGLGHVALSVGGGYCISTSVGPGKSIGKVAIADLTRAWGMTPLGWTEDYHGKRIYTAPAPKPTPPPKVAKVSKSDQRWLRDVGFYTGDIDAVAGPVWRAAVNAWIRAQRYAPGLKADGVFGPAAKAHRSWTRKLQKTMNRWKGRKIPVDGDLRNNTFSRVLDVQKRNHPRYGGRLYRGALDSIPGPVFCAMLKIPPHPGA